jgi:hypothetical protein
MQQQYGQGRLQRSCIFVYHLILLLLVPMKKVQG